MKETVLLSLLLIIGMSAISGCHSSSLPDVRGDFLVSNTGQNSKENLQTPLPAPKGLVNDFANVLDGETKARLEQTLTEFKSRSQVDFAVVTVKTTGDQPIFDYSLAVARAWGVGARNPDKAGLLMLVAVDDRKWQIQVSRALEKVLSSEETAQLGSLMNAPFREKKYGEGILSSADAIIKTLSERHAHS